VSPLILAIIINCSIIRGVRADPFSAIFAHRPQAIHETPVFDMELDMHGMVGIINTDRQKGRKKYKGVPNVAGL
jgi:hypothetical protein